VVADPHERQFARGDGPLGDLHIDGRSMVGGHNNRVAKCGNRDKRDKLEAAPCPPN